ncbi:hypothetical protein CUC08_Gglean006890 [Alternaria sp. MG1]|nr:hypothetical protein CUC08_Gglean006890 [Alternaria sp. MG1]
MSGSKEYAKRIPDSEWDLHERTIRRLYIQEAKPLTAPGGVQEIMFRDFEFSATFFPFAKFCDRMPSSWSPSSAAFLAEPPFTNISTTNLDWRETNFPIIVYESCYNAVFD